MVKPKTKNILIITILIVVIGIEFWAILTILNCQNCQKFYSPFKVAKTETPEPATETKELPEMEYKIASVGTWQDKIKWARYHIVTGNPLTEEKPIKILAEKIIKDIGAEDLKLDKVEILFYHDKNVACQVEEAEARVIWTPDGLSVKILENIK